MKWEELSALRMADVSRETVCILPLGAVEQHGRHLPLMTDSLIINEFAVRLDAVCGGRLLVMPGPRVGCSEHHMAFTGTLTLTHETFRCVVLETLAAAVRHGFRRFLLLNGHGGNSSIAGVVLEQAAARWPEVEVVSTAWFRVAAERLRPLVDGDYPAVGHACELETSVVLALRPDLVDMAVAKDDGIPAASPMMRGDLLTGGAASRAVPMERITKTGAWGKPSLATAEKGRKILDITVGALKELLVSCWPDAPGVEGST
ncbi:MAG: creatininase family protein [Phycisphaerae bacterium]|nr:creatininase family protein [Phycisphaerae bacterium]